MDERLDVSQRLYGFLVLDDDCLVRRVNATVARWLGYEREELMGQRLDRVLEPGGWLYVQSQLLPTLKLQGWLEEVYLNFREKGGARMPMLLNAARVERDGQTWNEFAVLRMRQRARMEQEFLEARKLAEQGSEAKSKFLAMMSHELRTPLQTISLSTEMLLSGELGGLTADQRENLLSSEAATTALVELIDDILAFARMRAGGIELSTTIVPAAEALTRAETLMRERFVQSGLRYERECLGTVAVRCDPRRLQQILLNVLSNALKFTPPGGLVRAVCGRKGDRGLIEISDTGEGIPADQLERIFDPFVQLSSRIQAHQKSGIGLGLAISRELADAMSGDLTVQSTVGVGTTFTLGLPLA
jgi:PAS domain S-box-containing protein